MRIWQKQSFQILGKELCFGMGRAKGGGGGRKIPMKAGGGRLDVGYRPTGRKDLDWTAATVERTCRASGETGEESFCGERKRVVANV